jgi:hypothetical protein
MWALGRYLNKNASNVEKGGGPAGINIYLAGVTQHVSPHGNISVTEYLSIVVFGGTSLGAAQRAWGFTKEGAFPPRQAAYTNPRYINLQFTESWMECVADLDLCTDDREFCYVLRFF